jgi:hypothetical protein
MDLDKRGQSPNEIYTLPTKFQDLLNLITRLAIDDKHNIIDYLIKQH